MSHHYNDFFFFVIIITRKKGKKKQRCQLPYVFMYPAELYHILKCNKKEKKNCEKKEIELKHLQQ